MGELKKNAGVIVFTYTKKLGLRFTQLMGSPQ